MTTASNMPSTILINDENKIRIARPVGSNYIDHLPAKIWKIEVDKDGPFLAEVATSYQVPKKIFGSMHRELLDLITTDYTKTEGSIGALFVGTKGCGKTLLCEDICNKLLKFSVPVISIDRLIPVTYLKNLAATVGPMVLYIDEFTKIYGEEASSQDEKDTQEDFLTFLSDSSLKKVLFLFADNDLKDVNNFLYNRPGRIKYRAAFTEPGFEFFLELSEGYPIHPAVLKYIEFLLKGWKEVAGIDVLLTIRDAAVNVTSVKELIAKLNYLNVPRPLCLVNDIIDIKLADGTTDFFYEVIVDKLDPSRAFLAITMPGQEERRYVLPEASTVNSGWHDLGTFHYRINSGSVSLNSDIGFYGEARWGSSGKKHMGDTKLLGENKEAGEEKKRSGGVPDIMSFGNMNWVPKEVETARLSMRNPNVSNGVPGIIRTIIEDIGKTSGDPIDQ